MTNEEMIRLIIEKFEGGFVDQKNDPGGATRFGITQNTLASWRGTGVTKEDVRALTIDEAIQILHQQYLLKPHLDLITDWRVRFVMLDWAIHSGPSTAIRALQMILGSVEVDGKLAPNGETLRAVNAEPNPVRLVVRLIADRMEFLGALVGRRPGSQVFALGWMRRCGQVLITAMDA